MAAYDRIVFTTEHGYPVVGKDSNLMLPDSLCTQLTGLQSLAKCVLIMSPSAVCLATHLFVVVALFGDKCSFSLVE